MDDGDVAGTIGMGMSVFFGWFSVGRPARMTYSDCCGHIAAIERGFQLHQLTQPPDYLYLIVKNGYSGRIISSILQPFKTGY
jgi:hypothetical protein